VIAVGVPVAVLVFLGRNAVDDQIAGVIAVQSSDDIEEGGLAGAAGTQDRDELVVPKVQGDVVEGDLLVPPGVIFFLYILKLKHCASANIQQLKFDDNTVTELVKKAQVSKASFYRKFINGSDIIKNRVFLIKRRLPKPVITTYICNPAKK
jgi:hypothetical protein